MRKTISILALLLTGAAVSADQPVMTGEPPGQIPATGSRRQRAVCAFIGEEFKNSLPHVVSTPIPVK